MVAGIPPSLLLTAVQALGSTRRPESCFGIALAKRRLANAIRRFSRRVVAIGYPYKEKERVFSGHALFIILVRGLLLELQLIKF